MESNPVLGLLGFWMMLQLVASLALLIGGIYVLFCLGRAASGLDRMANAMEDWIALQKLQANLPSQPILPQSSVSSYDLSTPAAPIPSATPISAPVPFTPAPTQPQTMPQSQPEYSDPNEPNR